MLVSKVLQECELQQYTSVTFPAIGTGLCLPFEMGSVHVMLLISRLDEFDLSGGFILWWKCIQKLQTLKLLFEACEDLEGFTPCSQLVRKKRECSRANASLLTGVQRYVYTSWKTINVCHSSLICVGSSSKNVQGAIFLVLKSVDVQLLAKAAYQVGYTGGMWTCQEGQIVPFSSLAISS